MNGKGLSIHFWGRQCMKKFSLQTYKYFENLKKHFISHGISTPVHGNKCHTLQNACLAAVIEKFLKQYGDVNGMTMPVSPNGVARTLNKKAHQRETTGSSRASLRLHPFSKWELR